MASDAQGYASHVVLPGIAALGVFGTGVLARRAGLMTSIIQSLRHSHPLLPGTTIPLIKTWTHIKPLDKLLQFLITFFWPIVDGRNATINLQSRHFVGQLVAIWLIVEAEGAKIENRGKLASHVTFAGQAVQLLGAATAIPIWCATHLARFSAVQTSHGPNTALSAVPYATTIGLILPVLMMTATRGSTAKQFWIVMFQAYPILTHIALRILTSIPSLMQRWSTTNAEQAYATIVMMATVISAVTNFVTLVPAITSLFATKIVSEATKPKINPWTTFVPQLRMKTKGDMVEARLNFLKWDEAVTVGAFLIWSISKHITLSAAYSSKSTLLILSEILPRLFIESLLFGPVGAALRLVRK